MKSLVAVASVAVLLLVAAGCGGGAEELTLEEYFPEVRAIVDEFQEERGELVIEQQAQEADSEAAETRDFLNAVLPIFKDMVEAFEGLRPPVEVGSAHSDAAEALAMILEANEDLVGALADADSDTEVTELLSEPSPDADAALAQLDDACLSLQGIADDNDVDLDLDCELGLLQGRQFLVEGAAMEPTLPSGTLVKHSDYGDAAPKRGDIIVFRAPTSPDRDFIKRIIGLPGDSVEILPESKLVLLNGEVIEEPYVQGTTTCAQECAWTVPPDSYFVMGDNRQNSSDSRQGWFVPDENILGRVEE